MGYEIKGIKEFFENKERQFDIILRGTAGAILTVVIYSLDGVESNYAYQAPSPTLGHISIINRIKDDVTFQRQDSITVPGHFAGFIVTFSEDLINCKIYDSITDEFKIVQVNDLHLEYSEIEDDDSDFFSNLNDLHEPYTGIDC